MTQPTAPDMTNSPRQLSENYDPALASKQAFVGAAGLGLNVISTTITADTAGGTNVVLHSLRTTPTTWWAVPMAGVSYFVSYAEASYPDSSCVRIAATILGFTASGAHSFGTFVTRVLGGGVNVPTRLHILR
uniref:Uncharacterized protein n=1 Tax=viral metagenome TaxID=1070528 RepID=A0A6H1ZJT4_9ZZZZ